MTFVDLNQYMVDSVDRNLLFEKPFIIADNGVCRKVEKKETHEGTVCVVTSTMNIDESEGISVPFDSKTLKKYFEMTRLMR